MASRTMATTRRSSPSTYIKRAARMRQRSSFCALVNAKANATMRRKSTQPEATKAETNMMIEKPKR